MSAATDGSEANWSSFGPIISGDGLFVAYNSSASNLVPDDTNDVDDVFVLDQQTGQLDRISVSTGGRRRHR